MITNHLPVAHSYISTERRRGDTNHMHTESFCQEVSMLVLTYPRTICDILIFVCFIGSESNDCSMFFKQLNLRVSFAF